MWNINKKVRKRSIGRLLRVVLSSLICLLPVQVLQAQSVVYGKITDANTGEPLYGASVDLESTKVGTVSGTDGKYVLRVPGGMKKRLRIKYVGYQTKFVGKNIVNGNDSILCDVELTSSEHQLYDVVVIGHN